MVKQLAVAVPLPQLTSGMDDEQIKQREAKQLCLKGEEGGPPRHLVIQPSLSHTATTKKYLQKPQDATRRCLKNHALSRCPKFPPALKVSRADT